ncbi:MULTISPECIES: PAS domain-containing sensor histidine kinase [Pseudomonas]|uniref:histidine kinase n=1 Tax=Pseudomonas oryzihabitans TaxID=47885 RepID=A0A178LD62_9PSED|nr:MULTISPECIES: ATP-binding protein [Pseudomonas]OAN26752.1 hybrid sensor histidine kinase/response regulator [Pseudomonas oryzihabitans]SEO72735.1 PAS domain S-box-containing protein [Pseudomonas sp. Snoq117.2]
MSQFLAVGLFEYDPSRAEWRADAACAAMLERDAEALARGLPPAEVLSGLQSRSTPPEGLLPAPGQVWEAWHQGADGQLRCLQFQRREAGGVLLDVTAQRRHEAELWQGEAFKRSVMVCSVDCIKLIDLEGRLEYMNPGGLMVMEIDDFIPFQGRLWAELWPEGQRHEVLAAIEAARHGGIGRFTGLAPTAKGTRRWWDVVVTPILGDDGNPLKFLSISRDVSETVRAREALDELNRNLEERIEVRSQELVALEEELRQAQKMEAIGQLTGGIAHDFNNLLTGIVGSLDLMRRRVQQGRIQELERYLDTATRSAENAAALTQRLLAFARRQVLEPRPVDAGQLVQGMHELLRHSLGKKIRKDVQLDADLWLLHCDPHQLENAILNLAINARDAMPEGGNLSIRVENVSGPLSIGLPIETVAGDFVRIQVCDTGTGMDADTLKRACEPFFTTKPSGRGTGLGLSMIYGFVRQSGGQVEIHSVVGEGTCISLYLPRLLAQPEVQPTPSEAEGPVLPEVSGDCALIVEEEREVRVIIGEVLAELGYTPLAVADSATAVALIASGTLRIDLLVTSLGLSGLDGRQLAEQARATSPGLPVLYLSGQADPASLPELAEEGVELIGKPFGLEELARSVRRLRPGS